MTRKESRNVFSDNPVVFLQDLQQAIHDGFRVSNTNEGYPMLNSILKEVRVFRSDEDHVTPIPVPEDADSLHIAEWDGMRFILAFQNLVLQGFEVDVRNVSFQGMRTARMIRVHKPDEDAAQDSAIAALQGNAQPTQPNDADVQSSTEVQSEEEEEVKAPEKPEPESVVEELAQEGTATTALNPEPEVGNESRVEDKKLPEEEVAEKPAKKTTRRKAK